VKYATVAVENRPRLAAEIDGAWRLIPNDMSMTDVINGAEVDDAGALLDDPDFILPYRPPTIFGIGLNYHDTVREMGWAVPKQPYLFPKLSSSASGAFDDIVVDESLTTRVDWEAEVAVIMGTAARNLTPDTAMRAVFGYTAANDISARDLQERDGQWVRGKGLDTFCPLGPIVVTADEIEDVQDIDIETRVNGEVVQCGSTRDMIFSVAELISYCSAHFTLFPGDMILTGTPAGCGDFRTPKRSLRPGSVVEICVAGIGAQRNQVTAPR
jgi:5-carboxymethyl-2-hydroxymuconate isomerase